ARTRQSGEALVEDEATPMAIVGGLVLWLLRLILATPSTLTEFRRWALEECPVAPGRKVPPPRPRTPDRTKPPRRSQPIPSTSPPRNGKPGKQARMITLADQRYDLTTLPLKQVSGIANQIGAEVTLSPGTARRVLLAHVRALQNGHQPKETP